MDNCAIHHDEDIRQIIKDDCGKFTFSFIACTS